MSASLRSIAVLVVLASGDALALPDLTPEVDSVQIATNQSVGSGDVVEGCAGATSGRTLLRFGVRFWNVGDQSLVIGAASCPDCTTHPNELCGDPRFICSPADGHGHPHYDRFARYQLYDADGTTLLAEGRKVSFCVRETSCPNGAPLVFTCANQGIQAGCFDHYVSTLGCQYIDVTGVPNVTSRALRLRVILDPDRGLPDANRANNVLDEPIPGCGDGVVRAGEQCDGGPCCSETCRIVAAGEVCRPAASACDVAEACDGRSAGCPADRGVPGCEPGHLPCLVRSCSGGACVEQPMPGFCVIDDACVPEGEPGPAACTACDPARAVDDWSPDFGSDPEGAVCGPGHLPCLVQRCTDAGCREEPVADACVIDESCVREGTISADGCGVCKSLRDARSWSPFFAPDATGLRCRCAAIVDETAACEDGPARRVRQRVHRITKLVRELEETGRARRLKAATRRLKIFTARVGCVAGSAYELRRQTLRYLRSRATASAGREGAGP
ncbi:MAG: lysyl oxidase family protein [Thermodesulfobacteriota bacterium]